MLLSELVSVSEAVSDTSSRSDKKALLAGLLRKLKPDETPIAISFLAGRPLQSPLGVGHAAVYAVDAEPSPEPQLELSDVDEVLGKVAQTSGTGSKKARHNLLASLLDRATYEEQEFLRGLMLRNLRQGALEGVMADAVADALDVPAAHVRRAAMLEGDLVGVSARALVEGPESLVESSLSLFTAVSPMLAKTASSAAEAINATGESIVEQKLDGLRLQVHRDHDDVRVFTRNLRDVTGDMSEVVSTASKFTASRFILDGEGLLLDPDGVPMSFQDSMSNRDAISSERFDGFYFDILHVDGRDLIDLPLAERREWLVQVVPSKHVVASVTTADTAVGEEFFESTVAKGFEGVVVKDPTQPYAAGRRGTGWVKVKPVHTLDLVVLAVEWGSGRRQGWLSNLHLGARDGDDFVMLGKTFKGLTDQMLAWQTDIFLALEESRDRRVVYVRPQIVYEIAFDGVQRSTRYPGGVALRFARVKRYRDDKSADQADTLETVRSFLR